MKIYQTQDRETGTMIDWFKTLEAAEAAVKAYEAEDKANGDHTEDFYEISEKEVADYIVRTKKQSCSRVQAWAYKREDMAFDDDELCDEDSDYREFNTTEDAKTYWKAIAGREIKNSNDLWNCKTAIAAMEALETL